jgi:hypothetical protein
MDKQCLLPSSRLRRSRPMRQLQIVDFTKLIYSLYLSKFLLHVAGLFTLLILRSLFASPL